MYRKYFGPLTLALVGCAAAFAQSGTSAVDLSAIDKTANPCVDFYQYACGNWMATHPIPAEFARWGRFDELQDQNLGVLRGILEKAEARLKNGEKVSPVDRKIGAFYESCMDEPAVEAAGGKPVIPEIDRIDAVGDKKQLAAEVARLHAQSVAVFFSFRSSADPDNAKQQIAEAGQGGLGLPDKDFYFRTDPKSVQTREEYVKHVSRMFVLLGTPADAADAKAKAVMAIETSLASASLNRVERRDPKRQHNKMSRDAFEALTPAFDFPAFLRGSGVPQFDNMNVTVPAFYRNLDQVLQQTALDGLKSYMVWHYVSAYATDLSQPFVDENFAFYSHYLAGVERIQPRWRRCVQSTDMNLGEALGQDYVATAFAGASKEKTLELVKSIEEQMETDIKSLTWMSAETKRQALQKLKGVTNKIGYPERWKDYKGVTVRPDALAANVRQCREYEYRRDIAKIGKPVDRSEWGMTPPTVNAYYDPSENNINFPAGILQPPFYSATRDQAVNLGGIGVVIGHELTHGFDDEGRQFDADGNLRDWWTKQDAEEFTKRVECIANEYSQFSPVPDVHLNGHLTLGENGADNAGIRLAYMALLGGLENGSISKDALDGYTPEQRFFLGFAQVWCSNTRPQEALRRAQTDPHSPGQYRVVGTVRNMPEFGKAFSCSEGQPMLSANACRVW